MALVSLNGAHLFWPGLASRSGVALPNIGNATLDAAGEYQANIYVAKEAMVVSHVGLRPASIVASGTLDIRIETVDNTTGLPTGTLFGTNTNIAGGALTSNTWSLQALTASATIAAGDCFAVVFAYNSGTSVQVTRLTNIFESNFPYGIQNTGSPIKVNDILSLVLGSSSTAFYHLPQTLPVLPGFTSNTFDNTDDARRGMRFRVPIACRCVGIVNQPGTAAGAYNIVLRDDAGNELSNSSTAYDGNQSLAAAGNAFLYFDNPITLAKDTWYRATIEPSEATNSLVMTIDTPGADYAEAVPGNLDNFHYTTFTTGGGWVDSATTTIPIMDIIIDQIDVSAGGGVPGNMTGGLQ